jgi:signal transduction histidine kinase
LVGSHGGRVALVDGMPGTTFRVTIPDREAPAGI